MWCTFQVDPNKYLLKNLPRRQKINRIMAFHLLHQRKCESRHVTYLCHSTLSSTTPRLHDLEHYSWFACSDKLSADMRLRVP